MNPIQNENSEFNRRDFIRGGTFATLMTMLGGVPLMAQPSPETKADAKPVKRIKVAIIGLGPWGRELLDTLATIPQAEIVALCDTYPLILNKTAKKFTGVKAVADYKEILADKSIQCVVVATPTHLHKDIVIAALAAGKHVYCEAPLAHTIGDAKAIALAAKNAPTCFFQAGLQLRSDPQRHFLIPFLRSGALGKPVMARSQWHKKQSWRAAASDSDREKAINWRLDSSLSTGLIGEIGIHQIDQTGWFFMNQLPLAVSGQSSTILWKDGRSVPDTAQLTVEYPRGARLVYHITIANSFDKDHEVYYGSDAAVMIRRMDDVTNAWMFKEVDSPLLGWEVYARKDSFFQETGIALVAGASKQTALGGSAKAELAFPHTPLYYALDAFLTNSNEVISAIEEFTESGFDANDKAALAAVIEPRFNRQIPSDVEGSQRANLSVTYKAPRHDAGYAATVIAIKANEAVTKNTRIELKKEDFELA